jgi:hypothetical protein
MIPAIGFNVTAAAKKTAGCAFGFCWTSTWSMRVMT